MANLSVCNRITRALGRSAVMYLDIYTWRHVYRHIYMVYIYICIVQTWHVCGYVHVEHNVIGDKSSRIWLHLGRSQEGIISLQFALI